MNEDKITTTLVFCGLVDITSYKYIRQDTNQPVYFKRKLHKLHEIGEVYPAEITNGGTTYQGTTGGVSIEGDVDAKLIAEWVRTDERVKKEQKRRREKARLLKLAREAARKLKPVYDRAYLEDRRSIIRALVEELEGE